MAIITTIRTRFGKLVVILIGFSLALYIVSLAFNDRTSLLTGNKDAVGTVDGHKVKVQEYQHAEDQLITNYKLQTNNQGTLDDNTMYSLKEQAWNQIINNQINQDQYGALGLTVSDAEQVDMFYGADAIPGIKQSFTNPQTGQFDPMLLKNYVDHLDDDNGGKEDPVEKRTRWDAFVKEQFEQRLQEKYQAMITKALYVPKWMAQMDYTEKNTHADIDFVAIPYTTIVDSTIKVTDADLQDYLNRYKERYKQPDESREIEYAAFMVNPSPDDTARVVKDINEIYAQMIANPSDTNIIKLNSEKGLDEKYYDADNVETEEMSDTLFKVPVGTVLGPYFEDNSYNIAKLMDRRSMPDSVKARHILIRVEQGGDTLAAKKTADSLLSALNSGASFDSLAVNFSGDEGSKNKGGELGYVQIGQTGLKSFDRFLFFDGKVGDRKLIHTQLGYQIVEIEEFKNVRDVVKVSFITRPLEASSETDKNVFEKATKFASAVSNVATFDTVAKAQNIQVTPMPSLAKNMYTLGSIQSARDVVKWAYTAKQGEVSGVISCDNNNAYVVAVLKTIKKEGTQAIADIKPQLENAIRREKKGKMISDQFAGVMAMNASLESIAQKMNQPLKNATGLTFGNAYTQNLGYEPEVVGTTFSLPPNQLSKPIVGQTGVYVIRVHQVTPAPEIADYSQYKQQVLSSVQQRMQYGIPDALKKSIKIDDERVTFPGL